MSEYVIEVEHLSKWFRERRVLHELTLKIPRGCVVGLIGANGSGKSTLLKCILGLLHKSHGLSKIFGDDSWDLSAETKGRIGYVPQVFKTFPWMTLEQMAHYNAAFYARWDRDLVDKLFSRWSLPRQQSVGTLSPGQMQRLALVLSLGHRPELLILDEPVASLDPLARREFLREIMDVAQDSERTVLFSTHITSDLERVASHIAILREGRISFFGEMDELKDRFKRVRVTAESNLPSSFRVPGAARTEVVGRTALAAVPDLSVGVIGEITAKYSAEVAIEDLNLEEIFLELHHD